MLNNYKEMELSTQILIDDAINRGVEVEILDRDENFISLTRGGENRICEAGHKDIARYLQLGLNDGKQTGYKEDP